MLKSTLMATYAIWRTAAKHKVVDSRHTTAHARGQLVQQRQSISASGQLGHSLLVAVHHQTLFDRLNLDQARLGKLTSPQSDMLLAHLFLPAFISSGERG